MAQAPTKPPKGKTPMIPHPLPAIRPKACEHEFVYLRSEEKNIGYDRDPLWLIQDVYFCEHCLTYKRVDVRKERLRSDSFERRVVENLV